MEGQQISPQAPMKIKKPWLAALLNLLLPGLGYVYVGKRVLFGAGIIFSSILMLVISSFEKETFQLSTIIDSVIITILFAHDGYKNAQEVNLLQK